MNVKNGNYQVTAVAYVLGCTPYTIYSYFKDRHEGIAGGLTEGQLLAIKHHIDGKKRTAPLVTNKAEIEKVKDCLARNAGQIGVQEVMQGIC